MGTKRNLSQGDLLRDDLKDILNSDIRQFVVKRSRERQNEHCGQCPYFGACPGFYVADASPQQQGLISQSGCPARSVLAHIVEALDRSSLSNLISKRQVPTVKNVAIGH
jgi:radical SAM protein with 4Fe4S-binding SPASM domain